MKIFFESPVDELKHYLTLQLEAYHKGDHEFYNDLEKKILEVEKKL